MYVTDSLLPGSSRAGWRPCAVQACAARRLCPFDRAGARPVARHALRGLGRGAGCGGVGLCPGGADPSWPGALGAGPALAGGNRAPPGRHAAPALWARCDPCAGGPCAGRAYGDGNGAGLSRALGRAGRGVGRGPAPRLHRDQTLGFARRTGGLALLVDPARRGACAIGGARALARHAFARAARPLGCPRPWRTALAGGAVPLASDTPRHLGGQP